MDLQDLNCQGIEFSSKKAVIRLNKAEKIFGKKVLCKILLFSLYILGAKRGVLAALLGIGDETAKTTLRILFRDGLPAFTDRRETTHNPKVTLQKTIKSSVSVSRIGEYVVVDFGDSSSTLKIVAANKIQVKTVLLSLVISKQLHPTKVAQILNISTHHCRELAKKLSESDVDKVLIDKRVGLQKDYIVTPEYKAEFIQQYVARVISGIRTSSKVIAELVNEKFETKVSDRTVRWHLQKLGLAGIKNSLPTLVDALKKKS
jgi:hypothetical protein